MTIHESLIQTNKLRAALYIRYSSENQRDGLSIEYQREECLNFASNENIEVIHEYIDEALTGKNTNREAFVQMISDVKKGLYDVIIVYKFSRFARNLSEAEIFYNQIKKHGARLISVKEPVDDSRPEGTLMRQMIHSMDEYYSANLATFVRSSMNTAAKKAKYLGGILPFGFNVNKDNEFIENKEEADIVRRVFELRASGASPADILRIFHSEGVTSRNGRPFTQQLINKILRAEKYIGTYEYSVKGYDPIRIPNAFAPIVDKHTWDKVQILLNKKSNKKTAKGRRRKFVYPLTGKIFCGCCGEPFTGNSKGNGVIYYTCRGQDKLQICKNGSVSKPILEEFVFSKVKELILNENVLDDIAKIVYEKFSDSTINSNLNQEIKELKKERTELSRKLEELIDLKLDGQISKELLNKKSAQIEERFQAVENMLKSKEFTAATSVTLDGIKEFLVNTIKQLETADEEVKKAVANQFIDEIIVNEHDVNVKLTVSPFFLGDKLNEGWALFTLSPKRKRNRSGFTLLHT